VAPEIRWLGRLNHLVEWLWPKQPALQFGIALVCLLVGYVIGFRIDGGGKGSNGDVAQLRTEVVNMQRLVMLSLLKTESASERIRGANWTERISRPDTDVFSALFESLNYDPVVNVRLAALEALSKYYDETEVKKGIIGSLLRQVSPLVQLAIVQVISSVHDSESISALRELLKNKDLNKTVREQVEKRIKEMESEGIH
jgi:HEAT repeat protein